LQFPDAAVVRIHLDWEKVDLIVPHFLPNEVCFFFDFLKKEIDVPFGQLPHEMVRKQ
jgi:hypothetical protein